jgi:hypothetical protein
MRRPLLTDRSISALLKAINREPNHCQEQLTLCGPYHDNRIKITGVHISWTSLKHSLRPSRSYHGDFVDVHPTIYLASLGSSVLFIALRCFHNVWTSQNARAELIDKFNHAQAIG